MTTEEFNALPLEARRFIETHAGCLSCGNASTKLTRAYGLYKNYKMAHVYVLFGGGINYRVEGKTGVLYNVKDTDTEVEIREKLDLAEQIHAKNPEVFMTFDQKAIDALRETLPEPEVIDLRTEEEKEAEAQAEKDALELWAKRSEALGIDTKTANYPELQAFTKEKGLAVDAQAKKVVFVEAINALDVDLL